MVTTRKGKLSDLRFDPDNANRGTERGAFQLEQSLQRLGAGRSIVIDRNGVIIAGNKTAEEAGQLGIDDIIIVQTDGKRLVAVQRTDLDLEEDAAARELAFADNRVGEIDLDYDGAAFTDLPAGTDITWLFADGEIAKIAEDLVIEQAMAQADTFAQEIRQRPADKPKEHLPGDAPRMRTVQMVGPMSDADVARLKADWYGKGVQVREVTPCPPASTSASTATT